MTSKRWIAAAALAALTTLGCATDGDRAKEIKEPPYSARAMARYLPDENFFPVGAIPTATLHDAARNRTIEMAVEYPTRGGPHPVIVFSHGYGTGKDLYVPLTEYWAGHGYIVIKPSHADAGAMREIIRKRREERRAAAEKKPQPQPQPRQRGAAPPEAPQEPASESLWATLTPADWEARARDVTFILDSLDQLEQKYPELTGRIQKNNIAVAGHSLGSFTAMLLGGMTTHRGTPLRLTDPRVKAVVAMSPQGLGSEQGLTAESFKDVKIPVLFMTGSLDRGLGKDGDPAWRKEAFTYSPAGDKYFVSFVGGRHGTFAGGVIDIEDIEAPIRTSSPTGVDAYGNPIYQTRTRAGRGENIFLRDRRIFGQIKMVSTAFLDSYMKTDSPGKDYMKVGGTLDMLAGEAVVVERK